MYTLQAFFSILQICHVCEIKTQYLKLELVLSNETSPVIRYVTAPGSRPKIYLTLYNVAPYQLFDQEPEALIFVFLSQSVHLVINAGFFRSRP